MAAGVILGKIAPGISKALSKLEYAHVSIPIAILIWLMIFPMMLKIDFSSIIRSVKQPKGLTRGDAAYTLVQVAVNDLVILGAYVPIVGFLLGISNITVPCDTLFLSIFLYVVIPLSAGYITRRNVIKRKGLEYFKNVFLNKFRNVTIIGLFLTLIILFNFQGDIILNNPLHIVLIAIPLTIQTFFIFSSAYFWAKIWKVPHNIALLHLLQ